jgi:hypothetical protein
VDNGLSLMDGNPEAPDRSAGDGPALAQKQGGPPAPF